MSSLKSIYKNDAILLQFCGLYLSLEVFNEIADKSLTTNEINNVINVLNRILKMNQNIKLDGQTFLYKEFASEIIKMAYNEENSLICLKDFSISYLEDNQDFNNLDYLCELKIFPSNFEKQLQKYKDKKKGNNKEIVEIVEKIISHFLSNSNANEKMYFSYFKLVSQEKFKSREELKEENNHLLEEVNSIKKEKENLISEKNLKIKKLNIRISDYQIENKGLKKNNKNLEMENESMKKEKNKMNEKFELIMSNISDLNKKLKDKDDKIEELVRTNGIIIKKVNELENKIKEKDNTIKELMKENNNEIKMLMQEKDNEIKMLMQEKDNEIKELSQVNAKKIDDLKNQINEKEAQIKSSKESSLKEIEKLKNEIVELNTKYDNLYSVLEECYGV